MSSVNKDVFFPSQSVCFFSFIALARTSIVIVKRNGERNSLLFLNILSLAIQLEENFSPLNIMVTKFCIDVLYQVEEFPFLVC